MGLIFPETDEQEFESLLNGWMDVQGIFFACARETHNTSAAQLLQEERDILNPEACLENRGWLKVRDGDVLLPSGSLTPGQKKAISSFATNPDIPEVYRKGYQSCLSNYDTRDKKPIFGMLIYGNVLPTEMQNPANKKIATARLNGGYWHGDDYFKNPFTKL